MSNKNLAQKWESLKYLIAAIGVNIIFYALIYFFGLISIKAKLNMLGIWTEISYSQEIFQEIFIDFIKITTEQLVLISTLFIPIVGLAIVVLFILLKRFKYSLDWNRYKPFPLISCIVLTIIYFFIFYIYTQPIANKGLLLADSEIRNDFVYLFTVTVSAFAMFKWIFYYLEILNLLVLVFTIIRLWSSEAKTYKNMYLFLQICFSLLGLIHIFLIPINYGILISPNIYYCAEIKIKDENPIQGYPIIQTDKELVIFVEKEDNNEQKIIFKKSDAIDEISFDRNPENLLDKLFKSKLTEQKKGEITMKFWKILTELLLCLILSFTLVLAQKDAQPKDKKGEEDISFLAAMFSYVVAMPFEKIVETLEILSSAIKSGDEAVSDTALEVLNELNVWTYDLKTKALKQVTTDGGYLYPRVSMDRTQISYIKDSKLWVMDRDGKNQKLVDNQFQYVRLLGWNSKANEYLLITKEDKLMLLNAGNKSVKEIAFNKGKFKDVTLEGVIQLSQKSASGKSIYSVKEQDLWNIQEDHEDYDEVKVLIEDKHILYSPSWVEGEDKIIFVSNMKQVK